MPLILIVNATGHASEDHMPFVAASTSVFTGILLGFTLDQGEFLFGMGYALILAVLTQLPYAAARMVDPLEITVNPGKTIKQALVRFKQETGGYPSDLDQLSLDYLIHRLRSLTG